MQELLKVDEASLVPVHNIKHLLHEAGVRLQPKRWSKFNLEREKYTLRYLIPRRVDRFASDWLRSCQGITDRVVEITLNPYAWPTL